MILKTNYLFAWLFLTSICHANDQVFLPKSSGGQILHYKGFSLEYDESKEQAKWVAYQLTRNEVTNKVAKRRDNFRPDPQVKTGTATLNDYKRSGFDRGHMVPAADLAWSYESMSDSFYLSNMSPQEPSFNRGIWRLLEEKVRDWAVERDLLYVLSGPIYKEDLGAIGQSHVDIPSHYFKIVFDYKEPDIGIVAFMMANEGSKGPLSKFIVSVNEIEKLTGIDFFYQLEDEGEEVLENMISSTSWSWGGGARNYSSKQIEGKEVQDQTESIQAVHWITKSSSKRHNSSCRYYKKTKGHLGSKGDGVACKVCGG
jgi:endonuclease G, mitochondrial